MHERGHPQGLQAVTQGESNEAWCSVCCLHIPKGATTHFCNSCKEDVCERCWSALEKALPLVASSATAAPCAAPAPRPSSSKPHAAAPASAAMAAGATASGGGKQNAGGGQLSKGSGGKQNAVVKQLEQLPRLQVAADKRVEVY